MKPCELGPAGHSSRSVPDAWPLFAEFSRVGGEGGAEGGAAVQLSDCCHSPA